MVMTDADIALLTKQILSLINNKPIPPDSLSSNPELAHLEEAILYLSNCLAENDRFLASLCSGQFTGDETPSRHNYLAGRLKELSSILNHLTWQTQQIAKGTYKQKINFLGNFSDAFNTMIERLADREASIIAKTQALAKSNKMFTSIMNMQDDWVLIKDIDTGNFVYVNESAQKNFYAPAVDECMHEAYEHLIQNLKGDKESDFYSGFSFISKLNNKIFSIKKYQIEWDEKDTNVYYISDITLQVQEKKQLETMVFTDAMTGTYNRRFCVEKIAQYFAKKQAFSLAVLDLDKLKDVNDKFGHSDGDDYICTVANILKQNIRGTDFVCRIGGDEFVVLLPGCPKKLAESKMKTSAAAITQTQKRYSLSISYGIVFSLAASYTSPNQLIKQADRKMYTMKKKHHKELS